MRLCLLLLLALTGAGAALAEGVSPHRMTDEKGNLDMATCGTCHDESLALSQPKDETCTLCHAATQHAGSAEHLAASAAAVARLLPKASGERPAIPLTDDGRMYCGSCHLFHDPKVAGEDWRTAAQVEITSDFGKRVRAGLEKRLGEREAARGVEAPQAKFVREPTRALRLPYAGGTLCLHCHRSKGER